MSQFESKYAAEKRRMTFNKSCRASLNPELRKSTAWRRQLPNTVGSAGFCRQRRLGGQLHEDACQRQVSE